MPAAVFDPADSLNLPAFPASPWEPAAGAVVGDAEDPGTRPG